MADLNSIWDDSDLEMADNVQASTGVPEPVPPGDYTLELTGQELKPTSKQTGILLSCAFTILDTEYEGRKVFANFNVKNTNQVAQQIGLADLKQFCNACGISFADAKNDTTMLLGIPFMAKVGMTKPKDGYEPRNEIKKYYPAESAAPAPAPAARPAAPAARPAAASPAAGGRAAPAWMQKRTG